MAVFTSDYEYQTDAERWSVACQRCGQAAGPFEREQAALDWSDRHSACEGSRKP
ncbi:MAG TPA: hypothetical protein VFA45_11205 [Actinomycetes bacterium]|nr:hypothetical protein [Actinomycetes bacterium]